MRRGVDYEWEQTKELPERQIICGFCGSDITTKTGFTGWLRNGVQVRIDIYLCHACGSPNFIDHNSDQHPIYLKARKIFSDFIKSVSSKFVEVYHQAVIAEKYELTEITGPGFRKALEFLIKDYVIKLDPSLKSVVENERLGTVIKNRIQDNKLEEVSSRAAWLGNDELHYVRVWSDKEIKDLKKMIDLVVHYIDMEESRKEILKNMPSKPPKGTR